MSHSKIYDFGGAAASHFAAITWEAGMRTTFLLIVVLLAGCSQKTDADRCVDAQMKVYDEQNPNVQRTDRDEFKAYAYRACSHSGA